jgi:hypothetical protein
MAAFRDVANMKVLTFRGNNCLPLPVESDNVVGVKKQCTKINKKKYSDIICKLYAYFTYVSRFHLLLP